MYDQISQAFAGPRKRGHTWLQHAWACLLASLPAPADANAVFLFLVHPYDVGDVLLIDGEQCHVSSAQDGTVEKAALAVALCGRRTVHNATPVASFSSLCTSFPDWPAARLKRST